MGAVNLVQSQSRAHARAHSTGAFIFEIFFNGRGVPNSRFFFLVRACGVRARTDADGGHLSLSLAPMQADTILNHIGHPNLLRITNFFSHLPA